MCIDNAQYGQVDHAFSLALFSISFRWIIEGEMAVNVPFTQQRSSPDPMRINSLLNDQGTPMPQYSQPYSVDLPQPTQHSSRLENEAQPTSMLQRHCHSSNRPYVQMLELSPTVTEQTSVDHDTECAPVLPARRNKYSREEFYFIWHQRVVLQHSWCTVLKNFNSLFPNRQRLPVKRCGYAGIQKNSIV
ncbi:hypothetical protein N7522_013236 [Penicillium canescens]|nr:hypothetical protein N7522_013236 [Penicillium canescens]